MQAFCTVASVGSITKAARNLNISQPALSLQILELEKHLQTTLFTRSNKGVVLTETGEIVLNYCNKILNLVNNMQTEINKYQCDHIEELLIGASCTVGNFAMPCSVFIFQEQFPEHSLKLAISHTNDVLEKLFDGNLVLGVIEGLINESLKQRISREGFQYKKIAQDNLTLVAPYTDEWIKKNVITIAELKALPLILREKGCGIRQSIEYKVHEEGLNIEELNVLFDLNSINAIISSVAAGNGLSILPKMSVRKELRHRILKAVSIENFIFNHNIYLVYKPLDKLKPVASSFVKFLLSPQRGFC